MSNQTEWPNYGAGLELLRQEHLAALSELMTAPGCTKTELLRLRKELADEHLLRRAQERKSIAAQMRDDHVVELKSR